MRATIHERRRREPASIAFSVAAHVVVIAMIASITFRYPFLGLFSHDKPTQTERLQYVVVRPQPQTPIGNGSNDMIKPKKAIKPAPLVAPTFVPTELPPVAPAVSAGAISGTGTGSGGAPAGLATGIEPALPDARIELKPNTLRIPLSQAERNDSAVTAIILEFRAAEIAAAENKGRSPKDWTIGSDGQKYGLDSQYIYLGKFKVPSAILAALPLHSKGVDGAALTRQRNADWIHDDIMSHAQGLSEEDFRSAVRRIRERKEREKKEAEDEKEKKADAQKPTPIVP